MLTLFVVDIIIINGLSSASVVEIGSMLMATQVAGTPPSHNVGLRK